MSTRTMGRRGNPIETKRIKVSKKRQITIPQRFFEKLNIDDEVECEMTNAEIIIRPVRQETEFAEDILKDICTTITKLIESSEGSIEIKREP